jgi:hypothetical protein
MDSHTKPYICPDGNCPRNKRGFSRKDNLNVHLQNHRKRKMNQRRHRELSGSPRAKREGGNLRDTMLCGNLGDMLLGGVAAGRMGGRAKNLSTREKRLLRIMKLMIEFVVDEENEENENYDDEEEEEEEDEE